ncbi:hypothetical protein Rhow_001990 [Rhodococcus wratislaviensis]|uniref:Uncharacterized protein n=1 Tax=Rhodococcus wratislaviensis TaxID=44752 RepID=A0A402C4E5_RHOWR|nr:hypothetical protein Rhow_001990 [Rhodococcus wratislaviensis]
MGATSRVVAPGSSSEASRPSARHALNRTGRGDNSEWTGIACAQTCGQIDGWDKSDKFIIVVSHDEPGTSTAVEGPPTSSRKDP